MSRMLQCAIVAAVNQSVQLTSLPVTVLCGGLVAWLSPFARSPWWLLRGWLQGSCDCHCAAAAVVSAVCSSRCAAVAASAAGSPCRRPSRARPRRGEAEVEP